MQETHLQNMTAHNAARPLEVRQWYTGQETQLPQNFTATNAGTLSHNSQLTDTQ